MLSTATSLVAPKPDLRRCEMIKEICAWQRNGMRENRAGWEQILSSLLDEAFARREPVLAEDAVSDPRFSGKSSIILQRIQAAVTARRVRRANYRRDLSGQPE